MHVLQNVSRFLLAIVLAFIAFLIWPPVAVGEELVFPAADWERRSPEQAGLLDEKLAALAEFAGGHGCVVHRGYLVYTWGNVEKSEDIASAVKPLISTLLLQAVQDDKLSSIDAKVSELMPELAELDRGKNAAITWRHLASQTSGYGLAEPPGAAYGYNDYALALYYDALMQRVYRQDGTRVLKEQLGDVLGFQDPYTFDALHRSDRRGRLAISVRDLARFGLLFLRNGRWKVRRILKDELIQLALASPTPSDLPRTSGADAPMLPNQRTLGGGKNQTTIGPGVYSFNWWINRKEHRERRLFTELPPDAFAALGHSGKRALWVIPSLQLIVAWNDANVDDHDDNLENPETKCHRATRLIRDAVARRTRVTIEKDRWLINGALSHRGAKAEGLLMNVRMVNAVFEDAHRPDFDPEANTRRFIEAILSYAEHGVRAFTLNLQGGAPGYEGAKNSAFETDGGLRQAYMQRVQRVIEACDRKGLVVILGCFYQRQDQILQDETAVRAAVANVAQWIKGCGYTNVVLEVTNEFGHGGFDHKLLKTVAGQVELMALAKRVHPALLVSTSDVRSGAAPTEIATAADFLLVHYNSMKVREIPGQVAALREFRKPVVCNEDTKTGDEGAQAAELSVAAGGSWGLMLENVNQHFPFSFRGAADDEKVYAAFKKLTTP